MQTTSFAASTMPLPPPKGWISSFHAMEAQLAQVCRRDKKSVKDYQENYFKELGFSNIVIERDNLEGKQE